MSMKMYEKLVWNEVEDVLQNHILIIPVGSMEQHGPHLPLGVDKLLVNKICEDIVKKVDAVIAPTISYGARSLPTSGGGPSYPGTIYLSGNTIINYYFEIIISFIKAGAKNVFFLNAHWENEPFIIEAVERCRESGYLKGINIMVTNWWNVIDDNEMLEIFGQFPGWHAEHAGQAETALMSYYMPEYVKIENIVDCDYTIPEGIYKYPAPLEWIGNKGVLSKTSHVNEEMGKRLANIVIKRLTCLIEEWER